jgi:uncharacterized protein
MITRALEQNIRKNLGNGKVQIIYGPRRIGKTTLSKKLLENKDYLYLDCDQDLVRRSLRPTSLKSLEALVGNYKYIIIDEAQRLSEAGLTLKIMIDAHPEWVIIATGSCSIDLSGMIREPLTGRANEYTLLPITSTELIDSGIYQRHEIGASYNQLMLTGGYPSTFDQSRDLAIQSLLDITEKYIFRDSLIDVDLRQRGVLSSLLYALAANSSGEISYQRLANDLDISAQTVQKYIYLLEQSFIVYTLQVGKGGLYNLSSRRKRKLYFHDLGVRNAILKNFEEIDIRTDKGNLWENLGMNELQQSYDRRSVMFSYWRNETGEVDLLVRKNGTDIAYEFKYGISKPVRPSKGFIQAYKDTPINVVNPESLQTTLASIKNMFL